jgi:hypothetical protein
VSFGFAGNEQGFVQVGHCCLSSPEQKPNKIAADEVKNKCSIEIRLPDIS